MKYTEQQIKDKADQIMKDLDGKFYFNDCVNKAVFEENEIIFAGKLKGTKHSIWSISIKAVFDHLDFLIISDETGEPLYFMNFNTLTFDIEKDKDGKYYKFKID